MSEKSFENVRSIVDEIAKEHNFINYHLNVKEDEFTGENYSSKIVRAQIIDDDKKQDQINLFIKLVDLSETLRQNFSSNPYCQIEFYAYSEILPTLRNYQKDNLIPSEKHIVFPEFFRGGIDYLNEFMIIEDLSDDGYQMFGRRKPLDVEHAKTILISLANYHSVSFAMRTKKLQEFEKLAEKTMRDYAFGDAMEQWMLSLISNVIPQLKSKEKGDILYNFAKGSGVGSAKYYAPKSTEPYNVICHGDFHINNMLFKYQNGKPEVQFVDWQILKYACPITDLMSIFYISTQKSFREKHFKQLCDLYYSTLEENLQLYGCDIKEIYPRDVFDKHLIDYTYIGLLFGILCVILFHRKEGDEAGLESMFTDGSDANKVIATEEMITRLEDFADDIVAFKALTGQ